MREYYLCDHVGYSQGSALVLVLGVGKGEEAVEVRQRDQTVTGSSRAESTLNCTFQHN